MGKPVTVDSDDLEKIIMVTGIAKKFEEIIRQQSGDPFISKDKEEIKGAHDRIAAEWRRATREPHPDADVPVTTKAFVLLRSLSGKIAGIEPNVMRLPLYQELFTKLMIEYGNGYDVIYWSSSQELARINKAPRLMVRVTVRGQSLINMTTFGQMQPINPN